MGIERKSISTLGAGSVAEPEAPTPARDLREVVCVAVPKILGGMGQFVLSLVLVRFLGPEHFGMVSVCLTGVLLLDAVVGSAIDMAIFRLAPLHNLSTPLYARQIEKAGLLIKPLGSLALLLPLAIFAPSLSQLLFQNRDRGLLLLLSFMALVGMLLFRSTQVHFQIERRFLAYGVTDLLHNAARLGSIGLLLAWGLATPERLMGSYALAAALVTAAGLFWLARPVLAAPFSASATGELLGLLRLYLPTVVVGSISSRMDVFFVSSMASVAQAGIYGAAQMFALVPHLLGTYMSAVFSPRVLPMWRNGQLPASYFRYQTGLIAAAAVLFLLAWMGVGRLGHLLLPEAYQRSVDVILLLLPAGLAALINFPWTIPFLLYVRPKALLMVDCLALPAMAAAFVLVIPAHGAAGAAAATSAFAIGRLAFYQTMVWRILRRDPLGADWSRAAGAPNSMQLAGSLR